jgi:hypothetical protein
MDLHPSRGIMESGSRPADKPHLPGLYSIPLRALYSRTVANLLFAGRNASASHVAFGSTRVMKTGATMGQAAGSAAALCAADGLTPRQVATAPECMAALQQTLLRDDAYVIGLRNEDPDDLARAATVTASSEATLAHFLPDDATAALPLSTSRVQSFSWSGGWLDAVDLLLENRGDAPATLRLLLKRTRHLQDFEPCTPLVSPEAQAPAGPRTWVQFPVGLDLPEGCYFLQIEGGEPLARVGWLHNTEEPIGTQAAAWSATAPGADGSSGAWQMQRGVLLFRTAPTSRSYGAANVVNGVARPEAGANLWISDPDAGAPTPERPQWLQLDFGRPVDLAQVQITFDSDLDHKSETHQIVPTIVRDYRLLACEDGAAAQPWREVATVTDNWQRLRRHQITPVRARSLRLEILGTNGAPTARVFEIRAATGERPSR